MKRIIFLVCLFAGLMQVKVSAQVAATITMWKDSVMGAIWNAATSTVAYGKPGANGYYKIYLSDSLGNNETQLTYPGWPADRHQWAEEWDPTGQYLFCYIEKTAYVWESDHLRIPEDAIPGYGAYTDVWLVKRDGSQAWQLTNVPNDYDNGVCHGAISEDGTLFAWTERILAPDIWNPNLAAGAYVFKTATVTYGPNPSLTNIQTYQPGSVLAGGEVESISQDNSTIAVYSTFESQNIIATPLYTIDLATGATTRLTTFSFSQCPTYTPDGNHFVYMTGHECDIFPWQLQGADWWIMDADSTNKIRLTYMNVTGHPQCVDMYRLAGSLSFMSHTSFLGGIMTQSLGLTGYTAKVSFANVVGVAESAPPENALSFPVFPNPATNQLTLGLPEQLSDFTVSINDIAGREVMRIENQREINISGLTQGSYTVVVTSGATIYRQLFSKQ